MVANARIFPAARPMAPAVFIGVQDGFGLRPSFRLFNLTADIAGHPAGSTVSEETLTAAGFTVNLCTEIAPEQVAAAPVTARCIEIVAHPQGGWTHAVPSGDGTKRIYRGNWPTRSAARVSLFFCTSRKTPTCA